ncbi:precorrin-3B synthase [Saccharomonospora amisosensis]|uniref:Precorrin-3B synthase n=1 Tax=Saccharomonospora amisosensis TaxID=1128677 RepID=A0A7X5ZSB0_9PSEU|nr:precorrin-3B synthase [Saccharomonospora amisosensis]NIJ13722.1 precorrin-3B synthase [Saccharomonospora amisosensis]
MPSRTRPDACPGVLATHEAADGPLARVRLPGGLLRAEQARVLADCADELGDGAVHLTSRGNLQLRAVRDIEELAERLSHAGLLPSAGHDRVRNVLASPLSGLHGGLTDVRPLVVALDEAVRTSDELAGLPGRFLLAADDGRGDVAGEGADACWRATSPLEGALLLDGTDTGLRVPACRAASALVELALAFQRVRGRAWRVGELDSDGRAGVLDSARPLARRVEPTRLPSSGPPRVGAHGRAVVAAVPFGQLRATVLRSLGELVVTPWRTLVVTGVDGQRLADLGLVVDQQDPSLGVSACIGSPGCAKSRSDVRADATAVLGLGVRAHFSGCERRCGKPREPHLDVLADAGGYRVEGNLVPTAELGDALKGRL